MKRLILASMLLLAATQTSFAQEFPTVNLPQAMRQKNWLGNEGEGSCVHASMTMLFRWQGRYKLAEYWRTHYSNGEYSTRLSRRLTAEGIMFCQTVTHQESFLKWACGTRRGCAVSVMGGRHMVCLVHYDGKWAGILDNNYPDRIRWETREAFLREWTGWAITPISGSPAPPLPPKEPK